MFFEKPCMLGIAPGTTPVNVTLQSLPSAACILVPGQSDIKATETHRVLLSATIELGTK